MQISYNTDYTASKYAFDTTRKSAAVAAKAENMANVEIVDPSQFYAATEELVTRNHRTGYVLAVKSGEPYHLAESQGFMWDEGIYTMAIAHNAGVVASVNTVLNNPEHRVAGSLSSGLHHAKWDSGDGFCTFNGVAIGAWAAADLGAERILIFDFDAHCGGGTNEVRPKQTVQVDISVSPFDRYEPTDDSRLVILDYADDALYLKTIKAGLEYASSLGSFDLMIYNAGMDPYNSGISQNALAQREQMVANWVTETNTPSVFTLAGGYTWGGVTMDELADLHCLTIEQFAQIPAPIAS
jgi:acetoin utilization deacetylase AcuC-like enzyme